MSPGSSKAPGVASARGLQEITNTNRPIVAPSAEACNGLTFAQEKILATLIAQLALRGHAVHQLPDGFIVARWGLSKFCPGPGLDALRNFARQIGVTA